MMTSSGGGEDSEEFLAPVIPLFGGDAKTVAPEERDRPVFPRRTGETGIWRSTWDDESSSGPGERHPAFGGRARKPEGEPRVTSLRPVHSRPEETSTTETSDEDPDDVRRAAEESLVRKLRGRAMSVSEARGVLRERGLSGEQVVEVIEDFERRRYLDDRTLAGHLVTSGVERKGQGRVALSRALAQRGIPRDVIEEALAELPDDDAERALEFARTKASSMTRLDPEAALRRLVGQLSRRGYGGSVAMNAARTALREASGPRPGGVRFVESD